MEVCDINETLSIIESLYEEIEDCLKGRRVRVISNFNNQPHGHSQPSWKGRDSEIRGVHIDCSRLPRISVVLKEARVYMGLDELEFLD